jgi:hypothetical protein
MDNHEWSVGIPLTGLSPPQFCSYPKPGTGFPTSCTIARKKLSEQAQKVLYALYRKLRNISIPIDLQLKLFDYLIEPILLYSSEILGFENFAVLKRIHLQFFKRILSVRFSTPSFMVYSETGCYPLQIKIKLRVLNFGVKLLQNEDKLCSNMYQLVFYVSV